MFTFTYVACLSFVHITGPEGQHGPPARRSGYALDVFVVILDLRLLLLTSIAFLLYTSQDQKGRLEPKATQVTKVGIGEEKHGNCMLEFTYMIMN